MAGDVLFNDVVLLLHCDGSDGGTTFTDVIGHTVTVGGNAHTEVDQYKFGTASLQLDGSGDYLTSADSTDWDLGIDDFCIEFWGRSLNKGGSSAGLLIGQAANLGAATASWAIYHSGSAISFSATTGTASWNVINISGSDSTAATWRHYCVERYGSTVTIYVDGLSKASGTPAAAFSNAGHALRIGDGTDGANPASGYIDEIRFTKAARYKGEFTPPSAAFADYQENAGTGSLVSQSATIAGSGTVQGERTGIGALSAQSPTISGSGRAFTTLTGTGALAAQSASIAGLGSTLLQVDAPPSTFFNSHTPGTDYLWRTVPGGFAQDKWSYCTWLYLPAGFDPDYETIFAILNDDDGGPPDDERTFQFGATLGYLGWYDGTSWSWWELDSALPTETPVCIQFDYDSAQATADDRLRLYVNGMRQSYEAGYSNPPAQHADTFTGFASATYVISGYMLGVSGGGYGVDNLSPRIWQGTSILTSGSNPVASECYAGLIPVVYGTAGFQLRYATAAAIASDTSGNGNDFTLAGDASDSYVTEQQSAATPVAIGITFPVRIGLPVRIDIYSAVTPSLPITIGPYPVTPTLPITFKTPVAVTLPSVTITFPGSYTAIVSDLLKWTPKCVLDGTNISSKLIGAQDIEFEEGAAPVATFSFIPAAGSVDPLLYVGKTVKLSITIGTATYLAFTGVVSDPVWNADDRTITVSATGDLQSRLDRMSKTAILAQVGGTFSEYIFDDPDNLSGWEYAEALLSTQPKVIWQDANGAIRTTSILAKATADYTFTEADILDTAQVVRWAGRMDIVNTLNVNLGYRFQRRRQRNMRFSFRPYQLETPSMYLSGNEGGWELPQRSQIESAANGGGWTVIGDIDYEPIWPQGYYSTYSDSGQPMMAGLTYSVEEAGNLCIGATWTAAKRWLQTITEQYTLAVTATDSIEAVGTLATDESYAIEDDATDEEWESSLDYDDYVSGALVMGNGVDKKADLDELRSDVTTAMSVALAKAQNDVLKSHRGTTVGFFSTYDPRVDLRHTVEVDTTYLECKGKVRRIAHHWDIDTGDATTEIEVALSRHNGSGLASSDTLTPPSEPADPTETVPATTYRLGMHIGGQDDRPVWQDTWDGYVVNVAMVGLDRFGGAAYPSTSTTNLASQYSMANTWQRDPSNPALIGRIYEPGMHILPPEIAAEYADPADVTATSTYDVEVPEDPLVLISG